MQTLVVTSVNISEKKGTVKKPVEKVELSAIGIAADAHSGTWHRQVSMLAEESILKFSKDADRKFMPGEFAENITTRGIEIHLCKPFDRFVSDNMELMVTQIGKKCHGDNCAIYQEVGNCVMPKEGIFVKVIRGGELKAGGELKYQPKILKIKIITLSDRASRGEYADKSGPFIKGYAAQFFDKAKRQFSFDYQVIPDETELLKQEISAAVSQNFDLIFTTGGTGIGPRDITPDVVKPLLDKEIPGIMELIRVKYGMQNPGAILSRSVAGIIANSLIYTMPGSPKAVKEYLDEILPTVEHAMRMIHGIDSH